MWYISENCDPKCSSSDILFFVYVYNVLIPCVAIYYAGPNHVATYSIMYEGRSLGFSLPHVHQSSVIHWYFRHGKRRGSRNSLLRGIYRAFFVAAVCFGWSCIYMLTIKLNVYVLSWVLRTVNRVGMLYMTCDIYDMLIHRGGLTNICIGKLAKHWVKVWLVSAKTLSGPNAFLLFVEY